MSPSTPSSVVTAGVASGWRALPPSLRAALGLAVSVVIAGLVSIALRQDSSWDLMNYHYYNAWAFVHARHGIDWAPAQLQSFYSPFLDLPFYAMVAADLPPRAIAFALAIPTGVAWYCFARIATRLFAPLEVAVRRPAIVAALALGVTAPMSVSLIGTTMNDWYVAALVLGAAWAVVRAPVPSIKAAAVAGFLVGAGAGLKLTGSIYAVGLAAALFLTGDGGWRARWRRGIVASIAIALAFALTAGPWMLLQFERYGNPLFPYYNDVFRSPWADPVSFSATRFGPQSWREWIGFPFVLLWRLEGFVAEPEFRDARPALLYALAIAAAVWRRPSRVVVDRRWRFLAVFLVASLAAWALLYRIFRYLVPLELLGAAFIVLFVVRWVPSRRAAWVLVGVFVLAVVTSKYPTWWRQRFEDHFLTVRLPPVEAGALVLLVAPEPMSYVLPSFPADARFVGLVSNFNDPWRRNRLQATIAAAIAEHRGPLYSLAMPPGHRVGDDALAAVGLERAACTSIRTNLRASPLELCRVRRR
ncbi:MAG: hypothetical protein IT522_07095 [Burkholderiales bacterium]|nr:hypothetical protein [Burkholderiales bacterium]